MDYNDLFYLSKIFDEYKEINPSCIINCIYGHNITILLPLFCKLNRDLILKRLEKYAHPKVIMNYVYRYMFLDI